MNNYVRKEFNKEDLVALVERDYDKNTFELISNDLVDSDRWSLHYEMVFKYQGNYYLTMYSTGATEMQYMEPFE